MPTVFIHYILLALIIIGLVMLSRRLKIAFPIVLVLGGLLLSLMPGLFKITIDPDIIFFIFLPPLLYEATWRTSWKEFWKWRRVITSFAFPIVILTSSLIAIVSTLVIPGFTLSLGFLLGGIVSPPDAISATTVMRNVKVPKALISITEGESLINDASSLIVFRYATAAVISGTFVLKDAVFGFVVVVIMGVLIGLIIGLIFYAIHRYLPTTASMDIVLSFVTPYCMYYCAESFHFSGVLSVVSGGLLLSNKRHTMFTYMSRIRGTNVWSFVGFVINGFIFMIIGLQLPAIVSSLGDISISQAIVYGLIISVVLIIARLLCTFGASLFTEFIQNFIKVADPHPGWKGPIVFGWAGMRGVVSLAAALSIPLLLPNGEAFPHRNLILFITFIVILATLIFQGLTLPLIIKKVRLEDRYTIITESEQEALIRTKISELSIQFLSKRYNQHLSNNYQLQNLYDRYRLNAHHISLPYPLSEEKNDDMICVYREASIQLLYAQRELLQGLKHHIEFDEDVIHKHLLLLDFEEAKLKEEIL